MDAAIVIILLCVAVVLFSRESLPVDIVTWMLLIVLVCTGILTPAEAFQGFSSDILIILASVFVVSAGLRETGVVDVMGDWLQRAAGRSENRFLATLMGVVALLSGFMNNTTVTALFVPPVIGAARKRKESPSKFLMPMAFASILGGTCTLIGTSTNVAVSGYLERMGLEGIGFFEFTPIGLLIVGVGIAYMLLVGQRFLPRRADAEDLAEDYALREYLSEIVIRQQSPLDGQILRECDFAEIDFRVLQIFRGREVLAPRPTRRLKAGDTLLVNGPVSALMKVREIEGIDISGDFQLSAGMLNGRDQTIQELLVAPQSEMRGRCIEELDLPETYGITVLAVNRHGLRLREKIKGVVLETGDILLVQGPQERVRAMQGRNALIMLGEVLPVSHRSRRGWLVLGVFFLAIIASAVGWIPLSVGVLIAATVVVLSRAIPASRVYEVIEWRLLVLIAGMTAFGVAMEHTGAAALLANGILMVLAPLGAGLVLAGFVVLTVVLTQPLSNAAAALVVLPVALSSAAQMDVNPRSFAIAVALAASVSLITPFEPSCLLVYGVGKYRFFDFVKNGGVLTFILMVLIVGIVPVLWPF